MNKITPFLWFDDNAEEAANFYMSVFPHSKKLSELRTTEAGPGPKGSLLTLHLQLNDQEVTFLNGGPGHPHTDAFSFCVWCDNQAEIDDYWAKLTAEGGNEIACGWLKDRFGVRWQIVPARIGELLKKPAVMRAMMKMKKFDIAGLEKAAGV
jgi:predicted 3-demethylubiquinone-9 3-methyltransferase (glyoxalase superfamily)